MAALKGQASLATAESTRRRRQVVVRNRAVDFARVRTGQISNGDVALVAQAWAEVHDYGKLAQERALRVKAADRKAMAVVAATWPTRFQSTPRGHAQFDISRGPARPRGAPQGVLPAESFGRQGDGDRREGAPGLGEVLRRRERGDRAGPTPKDLRG